MREDGGMVVIDGVEILEPRALEPSEVHDLARFNAERRGGYLFDAGSLARMEQMQLRFDWLGYVTEDGRTHSGPYATPPVITCSTPRRRWLRR